MDSRGKKPRNEKLVIHDVDDTVNERIYRSDAALQSSSSNYNSKTSSRPRCPDYLISHKAATGGRDSDCNKRLHLVDVFSIWVLLIDFINVIRDCNIDLE